MKIILFSRQGVVHTAGDLHQMFDAIARFGFDYAVNEEFAPQIERLTGISIDAAHRYGRPMGPQPAESVLVCYGGDGTLLDGIHRLGGAEIPVIGINPGSSNNRSPKVSADVFNGDIRIFSKERTGGGLNKRAIFFAPLFSTLSVFPN